MRNLSAEMTRYGVSIVDIQSLLDCTGRTVQNKLSGVTMFGVDEALKIRDKFFPGLRIEYLFATEDDTKPA